MEMWSCLSPFICFWGFRLALCITLQQCCTFNLLYPIQILSMNNSPNPIVISSLSKLALHPLLTRTRTLDPDPEQDFPTSTLILIEFPNPISYIIDDPENLRLQVGIPLATKQILITGTNSGIPAGARPLQPETSPDLRGT
jgi:hypothetical protein